MPPRPSSTFIRGFHDALVAAWSLEDALGWAVAAYVTDASGAIVRHRVVWGDDHKLADVARYVTRGARPAAGSGVLLLCADPVADLTVLREQDVALWRHLVSTLSGRGYQPLDWILAGGGAFRSMRLSTEPEAEWPALDARF